MIDPNKESTICDPKSDISRQPLLPLHSDLKEANPSNTNNTNEETTNTTTNTMSLSNNLYGSNNSSLMCRICHCEETSEEFLITPCYCTGTLKVIIVYI